MDFSIDFETIPKHETERERNVLEKIKTFFEMIKFEHSIFALPFAYIGAMLTEQKIPAGTDIFWITTAMVGARTAAMSLNRIIDREIDAKNPRTADRALPRGLLTVNEVWVYVIISFAVLLVSAYQLNLLAFKLSPLAIFVLTVYSYVKRFSWSCHFILGLSLAMAPVGAWIGIAGRFDLAPILLAGGVVLWVAGFDIIYALSDYEFDKKENIQSIPASFGIERALFISFLLHIIAPVFFAVAGIVLRLGFFYYTGVLMALVILLYEHSLVTPNDLSRAGVAFFNFNGILSMVMFIFTLLDILV